jgi:hypothetical protein
MAALTSSARNFEAFVCVEDSDFHEDMEEELLKRRNEKKIIISANHLHAETMGDEPKNSSDAPPPQAPVSYLSPVLRRLLTVSAGIENWQWWHRVEYQSSAREYSCGVHVSCLMLCCILALCILSFMHWVSCYV